MPTFDTDTLAELIRSKRECLVRIRDLGRRQVELIEAVDMTGLLDLLAVKQRSLMKLQQIEKALDPFRDQDPDSRRWRTPELRHRCSRQLQECETLLSEIVGREKTAEETLSLRRDQAAQRLQGAHLAGQARQAYVPEVPSQLNQLDLLSET